MTETNLITNKIRSVPHDNTLYLIESFPHKTGLFTSNGNLMYLVPNEEHCTSMSIKTDLLRLETNIYVSAFNPAISSFENGYYNAVEFLLIESKESESNLKTFVNLCLAHASYMQGQNFTEFFNSLVSLFQLPKEQQYKNLIGLMGELLFIEHIHRNYKEDISTYWHTEGLSSRLDFVSPSANFEVKTTVSEDLAFTIKHDQLFTEANKNYLIAVVLEESNTGRTLEEVITTLLESPDYCNSLNFAFNIEKEKRRISPIELVNKHFVLKKIYAYHAAEINPFDNIPDGVEGLSYKLNLLQFSDIPIKDIFSTNNK